MCIQTTRRELYLRECRLYVRHTETGVERRWKRWRRRRRWSEYSVWEGPLPQPDKYTIIYMLDPYLASYLSLPMDNFASTKVDAV